MNTTNPSNMPESPAAATAATAPTVPTVPTEAQISAALEVLAASKDHKVVHRLKAKDVFNPPDDSEKKILMVIDTETTGLDPLKDKIIEIGYVLIEFSPVTGKMYRVLDRVEENEDPGFPLEEITIKLTGITDEVLKGKLFDREKISGDFESADLVMAHNSNFDRGMLEVEFTAAKSKNWVCSMANGPWEAMDISSKKLEFLAFAVGNFFYQAHRALTDVNAVVELLSIAGPDDKTILAHVIADGERPTFMVWANGSSFDTKDALKADGYRWCGEPNENQFKAWFKPGVKDVDKELLFLSTNIYQRQTNIAVDLILPEDAYSGRFTERQMFSVEPVRKNAPRP